MTAYYFSNTGDDTTGDGSIGTPWASLDKARDSYGSKVAGDTLNFNGGDTFPLLAAGLWVNFNDHTANPIIVQSYGTGKATLTTDINTSKIFDLLGSATTTGGFKATNLILKGIGSITCNGLNIYSKFDTCIFDDVDFINLSLGVGMSRASDTLRINNVQIINSSFTDCSSAGVGGACDNYLINNNTFYNCGYARENLDHSLYITGTSSSSFPDTGVTISNNTFERSTHIDGGNKAVTCVIHGSVDSITIEDNVFIEEAGTSHSVGFAVSVNGGSASDESFNNVIVRRNRIDSCGYVGLNFDSCVNLEVYDNVIQNTNTQDLGGLFNGVDIGLGLDTVTSSNVDVHDNVIYALNRGSGVITPVKINAGIPSQSEANNTLVMYDSPLNFQITEAPTKGYLTGIGVDGSFTYTYDAGSAPDTDSFKYLINDGAGQSNIATVALTVAVGTQTLTTNGVLSLSVTTATLGIGDTVKFNLSGAAIPDYKFVLSGSVSAGSIGMRFRTNDEIEYNNGTLTIDGTSVGSFGSAAAWVDGTPYEWIFTATSAVEVANVFKDWNGGGIISGVSVDNLEFNIGGVITKYNIDSGFTTAIAADIGTGTMTPTSVTAGNWS